VQGKKKGKTVSLEQDAQLLGYAGFGFHLQPVKNSHIFSMRAYESNSFALPDKKDHCSRAP
jgi:hypothetical protein